MPLQSRPGLLDQSSRCVTPIIAVGKVAEVDVQWGVQRDSIEPADDVAHICIASGEPPSSMFNAMIPSLKVSPSFIVQTHLPTLPCLRSGWVCAVMGCSYQSDTEG